MRGAEQLAGLRASLSHVTMGFVLAGIFHSAAADAEEKNVVSFK
jgi:hypothetical protein